MKRTNVCLDCPVSLVCFGGGMTVGEIYVCGVCGGADFVTNRWELQKWLASTIEGRGDGGVTYAAIHIPNNCPRILRKDGKTVGMDGEHDNEGQLKIIKPVIYACVECFKERFSRSRMNLNFSAVFYYTNGRHSKNAGEGDTHE